MRLGRDRSSGKCSKSLLGAVLGGQSTSAGCPNLPQRFHGGQARWDALFSEWSWVGFLHPPLPPMTARVPDPEWSILGLGWELRSNARPGCQVNSIFGMRFSKFSVAKSQSSIHKSSVFLLAQTFAHVRHEIHHGAYTHRHAILYILIEIKRCHYRHNCTFQRPDVTEEAHTVFETQTLKLDAWDARDMALCWASSLYFRTFLKEACLLLFDFLIQYGFIFWSHYWLHWRDSSVLPGILYMPFFWRAGQEIHKMSNEHMFYALTWIHRLTRHEFRYSDPSVYSSFGGMQEQNCIQLSECAKLPGALKWKITAVKQWMT